MSHTLQATSMRQLLHASLSFSSRSFQALHFSAVLSSILFSSPLQAQPSTEGQHASAGRDVAQQQENDWGDNRWNRTEVGRFLASNVSLPGTRAIKGLSIKIGATNAATVVYDTSTAAFHAAWTGGFLHFDPARFGLIQSPRPQGTAWVPASRGSGWDSTPSSFHFNGFHVNDDRIILDYTVQGISILESPNLSSLEGQPVYTRSFEIAPANQTLTLLISNKAKKHSTQTAAIQNQLALIPLDSGSLLLGLTGASAQKVVSEEGTVTLRFSPSTASRRFMVWMCPTTLSSVPGTATTIVQNVSQIEDLSQLRKPGQAQWLPELTTTGRKGTDNDNFAVDTLTVPYVNPWKALFFLAGVDFTADGTAYACTIHGDVWRVKGIDESLSTLRWKRFATGLFQPLGLKVHRGSILVLGRDRITRLQDHNGDGEADSYESFCDLIQTSSGGHDYVTCLEKDDQDNLYFVDPIGVHRVSPDGKKMETLATGFRNPNGMGVSPNGKHITASPQQGTWTPSSQICEIKPGGYYGYGGPQVTPSRPLGYDLPLCWIPHPVDNSSGSQVWVPEGQWSTFGGTMLHLLWGRCTMMHVLRDEVGGLPQGAVIPLPVKFLSGPNRGSFNSKDGHLYVAGSTGWQTSAAKDGALQRVRFLNKSVRTPIAWHAHANGIILKFAVPLDQSTAEDTGSYSVKRWNYRYAEAYGSKDWSVTDPNKEGRDEMKVHAARLLPDGKGVFLQIDDLKEVMQMEIKYSINATTGPALKNQLWLTLNALDKAL